MRRFWTIAVGLVVMLAAGLACKEKTKATTLAGGEKISICVLSDRGKTSAMTEDQRKSRDQVGEIMEPDLIRILNSAGYEAKLVQKSDECSLGKGKYLLKVTIVSYNPGSKAARILVGYGAGATSQNNHYELIGEGGKTILAYDDGVGSSRDWRNSIRKLNENTSERITQKLNEELHGK